MLAAILRQGDGRPGGQPDTVEQHPGDSSADALGVLDADAVQAVAVAVADLEAFPPLRDAGIEAERRALLLEAEDRLEASAVEPAGGSEYTSAATA